MLKLDSRIVDWGLLNYHFVTEHSLPLDTVFFITNLLQNTSDIVQFSRNKKV
jgi:hypothetical protein